MVVYNMSRVARHCPSWAVQIVVEAIFFVYRAILSRMRRRDARGPAHNALMSTPSRVVSTVAMKMGWNTPRRGEWSAHNAPMPAAVPRSERCPHTTNAECCGCTKRRGGWRGRDARRPTHNVSVASLSRTVSTVSCVV